MLRLAHDLKYSAMNARHYGESCRLDKDLDRLFSIDGTVPSLDRMPKGCRFCARCLQAMDKCREHQPPVYITDDGHKVSCWKYENLKEEKV